MPPILKKRLIFSGITFLLLAIVILFASCFSHGPRNKFHRFSNDLLTYEMSQNSLSRHYMLFDSNLYQSNSWQVTLPIFDDNTYSQAIVTYENLRKQLEAIPYERLDNNTKYEYELVNKYLENSLNGLKYPYLQRVFTASGGVHSDLPILLAEYRLNNTQDVETYFAIIESCDDYFDSLWYYCSRQIENGMPFSSATASSIVSCCEKIMNENDLLTGNHFLITTFSDRLDNLVKQKVITSEQREEFCSKNTDLLKTVLLPSYKALIKNITKNTTYGTFDYGLCHYDKGKDYYLYLLKSMVGTSRSISEIEQMLSEQFKKDYAALVTSVHSHDAISAAEYKAQDELFPIRSKEDIMVQLYERMTADFPALLKHTKADIRTRVSIKNVPKALEPYSAPAFYLVPPIDNYSSNTIYVNKSNHLEGLSLYTTMAHEGFPGHLYQTLYQRSQTSHLRNYLSCNGYSEGWAYYVEMLSYDYATIEAKNALPWAETVYEEERLDRNLQMCLLCMLDISIHYYGAGAAQVQQILSNFGITDERTILNIYRYIVDKPAVYLTYYLGYLEILSLKQEAGSILGDRYSDRTFHTYYLNMGPCDFSTLREHLKDDWLFNRLE